QGECGVGRLAGDGAGLSPGSAGGVVQRDAMALPGPDGARCPARGTHEKQLSNVFAWLLTADATHELGDAVQRAFLSRVNAGLPVDAHLPPAGYRVVQEVDTRGDEEVADEAGMDIA